MELAIMQDIVLRSVVVISAEEVRYLITKFVDENMISEDMIDSILLEAGKIIKEDFGYASKKEV